MPAKENLKNSDCVFLPPQIILALILEFMFQSWLSVVENIVSLIVLMKINVF